MSRPTARGSFRDLAPVVLLRDRPELGLRAGDLGAVVHRYGDRAVEVEFVTVSGGTRAVVQLPLDDVRLTRDDDALVGRETRSGLGAT